MTFNVLVAEPDNDDWALIVDGIRRRRPDAEVLRVKDGEQAVRFLFYRGLFTEVPETPDLVVLSAHLGTIPVEAVLARLRQHPRTCTTPVVIVGRKGPALDYQRWLERQQAVAAVGTDDLEQEVAEAMLRFSDGFPPHLPEHQEGSRVN